MASTKKPTSLGKGIARKGTSRKAPKRCVKQSPGASTEFAEPTSKSKKPKRLLRPKGSRGGKYGTGTHPKGVSRHTQIARYEASREATNDMLRKLVIEHDRMDIFCEFIMGGDPPMWFHTEMMEFQDEHDEALILAFAGARKTQHCTVARAIKEIIKNPDVRILLVADAADQAKTFLRGVKSHFENNEKLKEVFGDFYTGADKWTDSEIIVNKRTAVGLREPTIMCAGVDTSLIGRHFEIIVSDDLVTEENSATDNQRQKIKNYFYKTLLPRLTPDGRLWIIGTRWHDEDLYGWLAKNDYKDSTYVLGIIDEATDESIWEDVFSTERMHRLRKGNLAAFELQWLCRSGVALGGIFNEDHFRTYEDLPPNIFKWQGVDLAAGQKARNDFFAHVTIGVEKTHRDIYLVHFREAKLTFPKQLELVNQRFRDHPDTVRVGIEANAYQIVMTQQVRDQYPDIPVVPRYTLKDKVARAQQMATLATDKPIYVRPQHHKFVRRLCAFPNGPKDVFDAFDIAVGMGLKGVKKRGRKQSIGLI